MDFEGVIIEESLTDTDLLSRIKILSTEVEPVTDEHQTPDLKQWTLHTVDIPFGEAEDIAELLSHSLNNGGWYADFKNDKEHYIVYLNRVFHITDRSDRKQYDGASEYGLSLGIPDYQVDFSPFVVK